MHYIAGVEEKDRARYENDDCNKRECIIYEAMQYIVSHALSPKTLSTQELFYYIFAASRTTAWRG